MISLENLIKESGYDFYFLVVDKFFDINLPALTNFYSISASTIGITLSVKNSGRLLSHPKTIDYIQKKSSTNQHQPCIISFKPSAKINLLCQKYHWIYINNSPHLNRLLEDKIKFFQICQEHQLPVTPSIITTLTPDTFKPGHIIQTRFGWAGKCTFRFSSYQEAVKIIPPATPIKITPYFKGYTLTNNCCLTHSGLIQSPPALQYTGLKPYTDNLFATVGRQWPCLAPENITTKIQEVTSVFSQILLDYHYLGFFGLDFLISNDQLYLIECNPRLTASFAFYTQLELQQNLTPLFYYHLAEFAQIPYSIDITSEQKRFYQKLVGSQLTPKNKEGDIIKKYDLPLSLATSTNPLTIDPSLLKL